MTPGLVLLGIRVLLSLTLYAFLGMLLLFLWKGVQADRSLALSPPNAVLVFVEDLDMRSKYSLLENNRIGRAADNSLVLHDETVSAHHARLDYHEAQWWLEDLGSRNGTAVNGIPLEGSLVVTYGDQITFGRIECLMEALDVEDDV